MDLFQPTSPMIMSGAKVQRLLLMPAHIWTLMTAFPTKESGWSVTWQAKDEMRTSLQNGKICRNTCCRCLNSFLQSSPMQENFLPWNSNSLSSLAGREATCSFFRMAHISQLILYINIFSFCRMKKKNRKKPLMHFYPILDGPFQNGFFFSLLFYYYFSAGFSLLFY